MNRKSFEWRAFQVDIARQAETLGCLKKTVDYAAGLGYNALVIYGEGGLEYKNNPDCSRADALTGNEYAELVRYCAERGIKEVVPVIPLLGHCRYILGSERFEMIDEDNLSGEPALAKEHDVLCVTSPELAAFARSALEEYAAINSGSFIHVGGDEAWSFATCPRCRERAEKIGRGVLLTEHFNYLNSIVKRLGKRMMIWGDMLWYYKEALGKLDKDIVVCDWFYKTVETCHEMSIYNWRRIESLKLLKDAGLEPVICAKSDFDYFVESANIRSFCDYGERHGVRRFLNTIWEMERHPLALCYPSLAFGAARTRGDGINPAPGAVLREFAAAHFSCSGDSFVTAVSALGSLGGESFPASLNESVDYLDPCLAYRRAEEAESAAGIFEGFSPADQVGEDYRIAAVMVLRRSSLYSFVKALINDIAREYRLSGTLNKEALSLLKTRPERIDAQIGLERVQWERTRPAVSLNGPVTILKKLKKELLEWIALAEDGGINDLLPNVLLLEILNNDCSLQEVSVSVSAGEDNFKKIARRLHCGPFGASVMNIVLPEIPVKYIRLDIGGLGQIGFTYARVEGPEYNAVPCGIKKIDGAVLNPEYMLAADLCPVMMGKLNSEKYFSDGRWQPQSTLVLEMTQDLGEGKG